MNQDISRYVKMNDWIFEIKTVRAIRVDEYGKPYDAIANICVNGDNAYIDGLMTKKSEDYHQDDHLAFMAFCQKLGVTQVKFDDSDAFTTVTNEQNTLEIMSAASESINAPTLRKPA